MALPSRHRIGHSKRDQFGIFAGYAVATAGVLIGAALLLVSLYSKGVFSSVRGAASDIAAPVGEAGAVVRTESRNFFEYIGGYWDAGHKNARLQEELKQARIELAVAEDLERENAHLRALVDIPKEEQPPVARSRLIGATSTSVRRFAYVGVGSQAGVMPGMPVRSPLGLVGRVLETGRYSARVMLLNDIESRIPVRKVGSDVVAFAEGSEDGTLRIRLINLGINPIEIGDVFITSGAGGLFRPGVAVAVAREITSDGAIASMLSNPAATDYVLIDPAWDPELLRAAETGRLADNTGEPAEQ